MLIPDRPIAFNRDFVRLGIGVNGALFLSQTVYWSRRTKNKDKWFYKTVAEWEEETGLTTREQRTVKNKLKELGVLEIEKRGNPAKNYFRINEDNLVDKLMSTVKTTAQCCQNDSTSEVKTTGHTTTETTTETTHNIKTIPFDYEMVRLLQEKILDNDPKYKFRGSEDVWADEIRKLREIDDRSQEEIHFMVEWCQQDQFWHRNILSTVKLRKQFSRMFIAAKADYKRGQATVASL